MSDARDRILACYDAFGRGDVPAILDAIAEDVDWGIERDNPVVAAVPYLANVRTREDVAANYFGGLARTIQVTKFQPLVVAADGRDVVAVIAEGLTHQLTGKSLEMTAVHHFTLGDDGRIVRFRPIVDTHAFIELAAS